MGLLDPGLKGLPLHEWIGEPAWYGDGGPTTSREQAAKLGGADVETGILAGESGLGFGSTIPCDDAVPSHAQGASSDEADSLPRALTLNGELPRSGA